MKKILYLVVLVAISLLFVQCELSNRRDKHEYVDLGLPSGLQWATCNIGAETPEEYGDYFAWGEVKPKEIYNWSGYKHGTDSKQLTKYCSKNSYGKNGFVDRNKVLVPMDDAAIVNWSEEWRMPTFDDIDELCNECEWEWTTRNGVNGCIVTGPNGNSIFLPAAGYKEEGELLNAGERGSYWASSLNDILPSAAFYIDFRSGGEVLGRSCKRHFGYTIRPVRK